MKIAVLMSTYQGEAFIVEQLASILTQLPLTGLVLIRDDGSTDATIALVASIGDSRIRLVRGENLGFSKSFFWLLAHVPPDFEMIMLADQDDVWLPEKIQWAWDVMQSAGEVPTLYCTRLQLVDSQLRTLHLSPQWIRPPSFANALCENIVTGCTIALNPAALPLINDNGNQSLIFFHDWWIYLVISAFGRVIVDDRVSILYRQHHANVVGRRGGWGRYLSNLRFIRKQSWVSIMLNQISNFKEVHFSHLSIENKRLLKRYFDFQNLLSGSRFLFFPVRRRQFFQDELFLRCMVIFELLVGRAKFKKKSDMDRTDV